MNLLPAYIEDEDEIEELEEEIKPPRVHQPFQNNIQFIADPVNRHFIAAL